MLNAAEALLTAVAAGDLAPTACPTRSGLDYMARVLLPIEDSANSLHRQAGRVSEGTWNDAFPIKAPCTVAANEASSEVV
ncbi:MAG: hypothetical protein R3A10_19145 [Caldilineaceae bacterium]